MRCLSARRTRVPPSGPSSPSRTAATLVRATRLVNDPGKGEYRVRPDFPPPGGGKIARADVGHFIGTALTSASYIRESPALAY